MAATTVMTKRSPFEVTVHTGREGIEQVREAWRQAASGMQRRHYFHDIRWYQSYLEVLEPDPQCVHFFVFHLDGTAVGVIPLQLLTIQRAGLRLRVLSLPQHRYLWSGDFVIADNQHLPDLARALMARLRADKRFGWDVLRLPDVLQDSRALALFACIKGYFSHHIAKGVCNYLACPTANSTSAGMPKKLRATLRNSKNRLKALGNSRFVEFRRGPDLSWAYDQFLALESSGWKGKKGGAITNREDIEGIYRRRLELFATTDQVAVTLLLLDEQPIAGALCFDVDDTRYFFKVARDESYNRVAPGHLMLEHLVNTGTADEKIQILNLVSGAEWTERWHPAQYKTLECCVCNWTIGGMAKLAALTLSRFIPLQRSVVPNANGMQMGSDQGANGVAH